MELHYRKAEIADTELLTKTRIMVLRAVHSLPEDANLDDLTVQSRRYYQRALRDGTHTAYLVYDGDRLVGAGGVSYFEVLPTYHNPTGQKAYIMNMYTDPACRRRGVARRTLDLLVRDARGRGVTAISLDATAMGRPLYEAYGFVRMDAEMELPE
ncbi:MAG: GNAT family N-acetyltransferase [Oscillibacter sp.]|jgi:GNAT superfamily N-acetyltransferase|nr:GNAT family N-acetyltransferase [Oscillibacter sp.]